MKLLVAQTGHELSKELQEGLKVVPKNLAQDMEGFSPQRKYQSRSLELWRFPARVYVGLEKDFTEGTQGTICGLPRGSE